MRISGLWKPFFLEQLRRLGSPKAAARSVNVPWSTATSARRRDPEFRRAWDQAVLEAKARYKLQLRKRITPDP